MNPREAAAQKVKDTFAALKQAREDAFAEFRKACCEAHIVGIPDREISEMIDGEYSRPSICQIRHKEPDARDA